jgi:RNA polymerase sigma-70 factor (ECF subfamily)
VALTAVDRELLKRCLNHEPGAWREFVDRFLGLIYHVIHVTAHARGMTMSPQDVEDLAADVMAKIVAKEYAVLRHFKGRSSLASYLTVISRRICLHELASRASERQVQPAPEAELEQRPAPEPTKTEPSMDNLEEVQALLGKLPPRERQVVRMFYIEGKTYDEISEQLDMPTNSIGPILTRARTRLRDESSSPK